MRRRIAWLVAATTSAVVLAFVIPLCLLVRTMAEDRGMAAANEEARNVAVLVSGLGHGARLAGLVTALDERSPARTSLLTADGTVLGSPAPLMARDPFVRKALAGKAFTRIDDEGGHVLVPVVNARGTDVVRTTVGFDILHQGVARAWLSIAALGLLLLATAVLIADRLGRWVSNPVVEVAGVAHRLREGDLDARAVPEGPAETAELAVALNLLAERITELLAAERASVGDLSHRLRTPVTALRLDADAVTQPEVATRLQGHIGQLQRTVDAIVKEARRPVRHTMHARSDADALVRDRVLYWSALAADQQRRLTVALPGAPTPVEVDAGDLRDIVDVIIDNVFAHTPEGTPFAITLTVEHRRPVLEIADEGPGIAAQPELSAVDRTGFSGLGLQIVRRTVAGFGGDLRVSPRCPDGSGTRVRVWLPAAPEQGLAHGQSSPGGGGSPEPP